MQGSAQQAKELGFDPKENGEPLKSCKKKKNVVFDLGFKRQNRHRIGRDTGSWARGDPHTQLTCFLPTWSPYNLMSVPPIPVRARGHSRPQPSS